MTKRTGGLCDTGSTLRCYSTRRRFTIPLYMGLCIQRLGCNPDMRNPTLHVIPKTDWISALGPFSEATVRINNYSPTAMPGQPPASAFHLANDSRIGLPNGTSGSFNIPAIRQSPYSIYINDLNSATIDIDAQRGWATISIFFEDEGHEVVGNCVGNIACICGDPQIDLDDAELLTSLRVGAEAGRLVIRETTADFRSTFDETGPCRENVCAFLCDSIRPDRESRTRESIQNAAVNFFNTNGALLETLLSARLRELGVVGRSRPQSSVVAESSS
jgi:hypothetical protein